MTKKFFRGYLIVALVVLLSSFAIIMGSLYGYFTNLTKQQMDEQLDLAAVAIEELGPSYMDQFEDADYRLTLIAKNGVVISDTKTPATKMENHLEREEIQEAMTLGKGEASRFSKTLTEKTHYVATRLSDGTVLRISISQFSIVTLLLGMLQPLCIVVVISFVISILLANKLSKSIVAPLNRLSFDRPLENNTYPELAPMLRHIEAQNKEIHMRTEELINRQREFKKLTENLKEGLFLLDNSGKILTMNNAVKDIFDIDERSIGKDFISIDRTPELSRCIERAYEEGSSEALLIKDDKSYTFRASKVESKGQFIGTAIVIMDETEKIEADQLRREFTANVSHELKTPLQSIIGSIDLMENNLVKQEDMPRFIGHIKSDATRLINLVQDILRLSLLDEGQPLPSESVNLKDVASDVIDELQQAAYTSKVSLILDISQDGSKNFVLNTSRQLVYDIMYNLCENAIKYNKENGSVKLSIAETDNSFEITVKDTGIGIPKEHLDRIFERFYRVDKSHSKETGGTGLGLSIVKHSVGYLDGKISIDSTFGEGTTLKVSLPKQKQ